MSQDRRLAVVGLGYVGLPVAVAFARRGVPVIGFDINQARIDELRSGLDRTGEVEAGDVLHASLTYTSEPGHLAEADFYIVTVPTPIDKARRPDLGALRAASRTVGSVLSPGDIVVYESTVYPGATEDECLPVLEQVSGLGGGVDFTVGYSPERINPGDRVHRFESIKKVVAGQDQATLDVIAGVYGSVVEAGVHKAPGIKVAEAAKVIENTQRDLNIALVNELALIFHRLGIDTHDVLEAAGTKWNFRSYTPGLVGGHCIGVDPYYLTHKAEQIGYHPEVILSVRRVNDGMGAWIAGECVRLLLRRGVKEKPRVNVLGLTFKEDVPDLRNSKVVDLIEGLRGFGIDVAVADPCADAKEAMAEYGIETVEPAELRPADALVLAVPHASFRAAGWPLVGSLLEGGRGIVLDLKNTLDRQSVPDGITLWRL